MAGDALTNLVPGSRLLKRLSTLTGPSKLSVGLPPSSASSIALRQDASDGSDPLVENMLRALIHMDDSTPRSGTSGATRSVSTPATTGDYVRIDNKVGKVVGADGGKLQVELAGSQLIRVWRPIGECTPMFSGNPKKVPEVGDYCKLDEDFGVIAGVCGGRVNVEIIDTGTRLWRGLGDVVVADEGVERTPRSDTSAPSPLTPTVLGLDLPAGRVEALPDHRRLAQLAWDESREWGGGFAQVMRAADSPTAAIRRRLTSIRCTPGSPRRRCISPYLPRRPQVQTRQAVRHQARVITLERPSALSPLSPATTRANRQRGWGQAGHGRDVVILGGKGRVMVTR